MPFRISLLLALPLLAFGSGLDSFSVVGDAPGAWPGILGAVGLQAKPAAQARVLVVRSGMAATPDWAARVDAGLILVLEGESSMAAMFGFHRGAGRVRVGSVVDVHDPSLRIVWQQPLELPGFEVPQAARVFARDRWTGSPLVAGFRRGSGAVLWLAVSPGDRGHERFPYLIHTLAELGLEPPCRSARLWAFFDYSYRLRADVEYLAAKWRAAGISALHVAAWHFFEREPARDKYLNELVASCHRNAIQVYAWFELPHVSEAFWSDHPEWREKTGIGQDAQLDWRKLMNLANPACSAAVRAGVKDLIYRFDWDGANLAELYFESLEGIANPARFTPMNADFRAEFRLQHGFDPADVFGSRKDAASRRLVLDFRAALAVRMQRDWLAEIDRARETRPHLDIVLTQVDDRFDTGMRDAIGADSAAIMPLLVRGSFTFLIEDPATIWHLGPQRYREIAKRYEALTTKHDRLGVDINIAERYQDVYPTTKQTGTELLQLVHTAAGAFQRVALYFENSLAKPDLPLLAAAAAVPSRMELSGSRLAVESRTPVGVRWAGPATVDSRPWPVQNDEVVWLPAGPHAVEAGRAAPWARVLEFNGDILSAGYRRDGAIDLAYMSTARAFAILERPPERLQIDGTDVQPNLCGKRTLILPRGQHLVTIRTH